MPDLVSRPWPGIVFQTTVLSSPAIPLLFGSGSHYVALAGLELTVLPTSAYLGLSLKVCAISSANCLCFL